MRSYLTTAVVAAMLTACAAGDDDTSDSALADSPAAATADSLSGAGADPSVTATVRDASGRELGTVTLTDAAGGIMVAGTLSGLPPGEHGMHLHMVGRCDPPAFESAGEHWNPTGSQHGTENPQGPHFGDLPNVTAGTDSTATVQGMTPGGTLRGTTNMLLDADGAALIIHGSSDDRRTNPSGGSGAPVACGVISG
jgi:Cu-Zn family superoxide dismutase